MLASETNGASVKWISDARVSRAAERRSDKEDRFVHETHELNEKREGMHPSARPLVEQVNVSL
jgi:hypothetical protein